ncbi:MAG: RluA family pseudouridine synthase [Oligoflexia bacterium]|nr:RluA family pseudouridine synthase [Oligoflexia bacterium]
MQLELTITIAPAESSGMRLDRALADELKKNAPHLSRSVLKELFQQKKVLLAGRASAGSTVLAPGPHSIAILDWESSGVSEAPKAVASPDGPFLPVIHEDENLLIVNKASGIPSVPHASQETRTAVSSALASCPALSGIGHGGLEPGLLHRLDNGTSGLLVFAKSNAEFQRLRKAWSQAGVKKVYRARIVRPSASEPIVVPSELRWLMAHDEKSDKRMIAFPEGIPTGARYRGKPMSTITRLIRLHSPTDLEIEIETGVMHQIRCVLATLGFPVLGDPIYGKTPSERLWLHAWKLSLPQADGSRLELEAPLPEGFTNWPL